MSDTNMTPGTESPPIDHHALLAAAHVREELAYAEIARLKLEVARLELRLEEKAIPAPTAEAAAGATTQRDALKALLDLVLRAKVRPCRYGVEPAGGWPAWVDACWELGAATRPVVEAAP